MGFAGALRPGVEEDSLAAVSAVVVGSLGLVSSLVLEEARRVVRRGRMRGCRRASRRARLRALEARSFAVGPRVLCSGMDRCKHLMEDPGVLGSVADAVRQAEP